MRACIPRPNAARLVVAAAGPVEGGGAVAALCNGQQGPREEVNKTQLVATSSLAREERPISLLHEFVLQVQPVSTNNSHLNQW